VLERWPGGHDCVLLLPDMSLRSAWLDGLLEACNELFGEPEADGEDELRPPGLFERLVMVGSCVGIALRLPFRCAANPSPLAFRGDCAESHHCVDVSILVPRNLSALNSSPRNARRVRGLHTGEYGRRPHCLHAPVCNVRERRTGMRDIRLASTSIRLLLAPMLALLLAGCPNDLRGSEPPPPGPASIAGRVASMQLPTILVVAEGPQPGGSDRAAVRLHAGTRVLWNSGAAASPADLRAGQAVRVWFEGPVMESYPVQVAAGVVVIDSPP
jgi:hypothetical protein